MRPIHRRGRNLWAWSLALTLVCFSSGMRAPEARAAAPAKAAKLTMYYADPGAPDIAGFWRGEPGNAGMWTWIVDGKPLVHDSGGAFVGLPYNAKWGAVYAARVKSNLAGKPYGEPHFDCWPRGAVHTYIGGNSTMILTQTPGLVRQIFEEQSQSRPIFTDGRKHPASTDPASDDYAPSSQGHSVGHWEGDTLVVDTIGIRPEFTLGFLAPHSRALHVIERLRRSDPTHLDIEMTVEDPKAFTKPLLLKMRYVAASGDDFTEDFCSENLRNVTDADGFVQTILTPKKGFGWDLPDE